MEDTNVQQTVETNTSSLSKTLELMELIDNKSRVPCLKDTIEDSARSIVDSTKDSKPLNDAYSNSLLALGGDDPREHFDKYGLSNTTMNWPLWLAMYSDSWTFKRAIDKPSQDQIRCGIDIQGSFDKKEEIERYMKALRTDFIDLCKWGALFGGSVACVMFQGMNDEDYKKPLKDNIDKWKKTKTIRLYVVDRWYGVAPSYNDTVTNMASLDFGKPRYYSITLADGHSVTFHHDYVLRYEHRNAPRLVKNGILQGWGYAEGSHIINELFRDDKLKASIQSLIDKANIEVIKMAGMRGLFMGTDPQNELQIRKRLEMVNWGRNFNSLTFLDKDDDYQEHGFTALSGLSQILEQNMWMISAALEMQGVLFGDLKNGFSNDVDALERYDEVINGRCESFVRPVYTKFLAMLYKKFDVNEKVEFEFNSLLMKKKDEERVTSLSTFVQLCTSLLQDGIITPQQYAKAFQTYSEKGVVDFGLDEEAIAKIENNTNMEMEGLDLDNEVPDLGQTGPEPAGSTEPIDQTEPIE